MDQQPHPFARFVRILGRGKSFTRSLTLEEAEESMSMILAGEVLPEQLGAFLMLLRLKEESAEEIAGFARAARKSTGPTAAGAVDVDWSSYAGKRRQLPWFLLAALVLARNGWRVFMHGFDGHTAGRLYTGETLEGLGAPLAKDLADAERMLAKTNFAYLPLDKLCPKLAEIMALRPILGLRSPVHTLARMINPFEAPCMMQGVFHPGYMRIHRDAAILLEQPRMSVFRGEGGEIERRPGKPCEVMYAVDGAGFEERWPPMMDEPRQTPDENMDIARLLAIWRGEACDDYAEAAIIGTLAIAVRAMGVEPDMDKAQARATRLWINRDKDRLLAAA
ncbi:glycosyl transferase family protein [Rhodoblastus sp.]|uniref:glycosyl transferase family protein n=1 Tax=Rhodoblastus sp. TaxID=1962975 RepID=UPI003F9B4953